MIRPVIWVGIDPGQKGAIAIIGHPDEDQPVIVDIPRHGKKEQNNTGIAHLLRATAYAGPVHIGVEKQGTRPGQSAQSTFTTGRDYGALIGIIAGLALPHTEIMPRAWKDHMLAGCADKADKANAEKRACQLYPALAPLFRGPRGALLDGRCDALLIAHHTMTTTITITTAKGDTE